MDTETPAMIPDRSKTSNARSAEENVPLYVEIQRDIEHKIMSGKWPPGHRVPSEHELVEQYGCARMTVNKALSSLAASGMIVRKRRSGSYVGAPRMDEPLLAIPDIKAEITAAGRHHSLRITHRDTRTITDALEAQHVGVPVGTRVLSLEVVHFADDTPFALEKRQISLSAAPDAEHETFDTVPPGTWLLDKIPWTEAEHSISAIPADEPIAKRLKISSGDACMAITRRTWKAGNLVTFVELLYPGDRYRFVVRFSPGQNLS